MPVIFNIRGNHKIKDTLVNNITKYIESTSDDSYDSLASPNKSLHKFIQYKIKNDISNLEDVYNDLITLTKLKKELVMNKNNNKISNSKQNSKSSSKSSSKQSSKSSSKDRMELIGEYETPNKKIKLEIVDFIAKGAFGSIHNATLHNTTSQESVSLNRHNNMNVRLSNIKALDVIVKVQPIKRHHRSHITHILTEYLLHLFLCYNRKCSRFVPKLYCVYRYKSYIYFVMEKLNGLTFQKFMASNIDRSISKSSSIEEKSNNAVINSDSELKSNNSMSNKEISFKLKFIAYMQQLTMILFLLQKYFNFVHGDLKPDNIMLIPTTKKHITINGKKIPTYGYIVKIIDFGFACIQSKNKDNIIVPTHTYDKLICNKRYIDILFLLMRIVRDYHAHKFRVPFNIKEEIRNHIKALLEKINTPESDILSVMNTKKQYDMKYINESHAKVEYRIVYQLAANYDKIKHLKELLVFHPKNMYDILDKFN